MEILTLGEKIKSKRKEMNMTLKELAGDRITPGQISLVESGKSKPSIDLLQYISEKLNTDMEYFLESEEKQATIIGRFYINIAESAISDRNTVRAEEYIEKGKQYSEKYNLTFLNGRFDLAYSKLEYMRGKYESAQQYCIAANATFLKINNIEYAVRSFMLQGTITMKMGYTAIALNYFRQGDSLLCENNYVNEHLKANILYYIALCSFKLGNTQQAVEYAKLASERIKTINDRKRYAETLMMLSIAYAEENDMDHALKYAVEANDKFRGINDVVHQGDMECDLGCIFAEGNSMDEAFSHMEESLRLRKGLEEEDVAGTLLKICENYIKVNNLDKAQKVINEAQEYIKDDDYNCRLWSYKCQYGIYQKNGMNDQAEAVLLEGVRCAQSLGYNKELGDFYTLLGQFYTSINNSQKALYYIKNGISTYSDLKEIHDNDFNKEQQNES